MPTPITVSTAQAIHGIAGASDAKSRSMRVTISQPSRGMAN